jgi:hypothetical protein
LHECGFETFDRTTGKSAGWKWPDELTEHDITEKPSDVGRTGKFAVPFPADKIFPKAAGYRPTRGEYAMWSPAKLRTWQEANGYVDHIPAGAFRD